MLTSQCGSQYFNFRFMVYFKIITKTSKTAVYTKILLKKHVQCYRKMNRHVTRIDVVANEHHSSVEGIG